MKKIKLLLGVGLLLPIMSLSPVVAETATTTSSGTTATTDDATKIAELKKRIEANKAALKTKLDEVTKKRLIAKCKPAQTIIETHGKEASVIGESRIKAYTNIAASLQKLADKLKANGKDTTEVEADLKVVQTKITALSDAIKTYQQTLTDLKALDCVTDPTAFQATLILARTQREAIRASATELHTYLKETVKPAFEKLKPKADDKTTTSTKPVNSDSVLTGQTPAAGGNN